MSVLRCVKPVTLAGWAVLASAAVFVFLSIRATPPAPSVNGGDTLQPKHAEPARTRSSRKSIDPRSEIIRTMDAGDVVGLQKVISKWFAEDPAAVRDWLESRKSLKSLQPALVQIARDVSAAGNPADALKWAERMDIGPDRDQALFEIYARGRRYKSLTDDQIRAAPFPPEEIDALLSGAADD